MYGLFVVRLLLVGNIINGGVVLYWQLVLVGHWGKNPCLFVILVVFRSPLDIFIIAFF